MNYDTFQIVSFYLFPKQLIRLSRVCRAFKDWVTYKAVINSVLRYYSRYMDRSIQTLVNAMTARTIPVVSPIRLLSIVCGIQCELMCGSRVNVVKGNGRFVCKICFSNSKVVEGGRVRKRRAPLIEYSDEDIETLRVIRRWNDNMVDIKERRLVEIRKIWAEEEEQKRVRLATFIGDVRTKLSSRFTDVQISDMMDTRFAFDDFYGFRYSKYIINATVVDYVAAHFTQAFSTRPFFGRDLCYRTLDHGHYWGVIFDSPTGHLHTIVSKNPLMEVLQSDLEEFDYFLKITSGFELVGIDKGYEEFTQDMVQGDIRKLSYYGNYSEVRGCYDPEKVENEINVGSNSELHEKRMEQKRRRDERCEQRKNREKRQQLIRRVNQTPRDFFAETFRKWIDNFYDCEELHRKVMEELTKRGFTEQMLEDLHRMYAFSDIMEPYEPCLLEINDDEHMVIADKVCRLIGIKVHF